MSETPEDTTDIQFTEFLNELDRGRVAQELGEKLLEVIEGVRETYKAGHLTLKIGAGWDRKAEMLRVSTQITSKVPQLDRAESLFFVTKDGHPTRQDPRQLELVNRNAEIVDFSRSRHNPA